jgi:two-component system LytT family sensor kinase
MALSLVKDHSFGCTEAWIDCNFGEFAAGWSRILSMDSVLRESHKRWLWIASLWSGIALFDATQTVFAMRAEGMHHAWARLFFTVLVAWLPWAVATPMIVQLGRRYPPVQVKRLSMWGTHLALCVAIGLISSAWNAGWEAMLNPWAKPQGPESFGNLFVHKFYGGLLVFLILYSLTLAVSYMLDSRDRLARQETETARLNEQLSKAQLNALRRQIEPHFLFNTLNAIAGLVREGRNEAAVSMISGLSDFLRRVVNDSDRQQVPLREEMEFLQKYLDIQKIRFADRLQLSMDVPPELLPAQVPTLILQPMVENAVKHGIAKRVQGGLIRIAASRSNGILTLNVYNDGPSLPTEWEQTHSGIGMLNVRTRLQSLYGDGFEMRMRNQEPNGVEVSVSVPFKE